MKWIITILYLSWTRQKLSYLSFSLFCYTFLYIATYETFVSIKLDLHSHCSIQCSSWLHCLQDLAFHFATYVSEAEALLSFISMSCMTPSQCQCCSLFIALPSLHAPLPYELLAARLDGILTLLHYRRSANHYLYCRVDEIKISQINKSECQLHHNIMICRYDNVLKTKHTAEACVVRCLFMSVKLIGCVHITLVLTRSHI